LTTKLVLWSEICSPKTGITVTSSQQTRNLS